jgi:hypothetical protein
LQQLGVRIFLVVVPQELANLSVEWVIISLALSFKVQDLPLLAAFIHLIDGAAEDIIVVPSRPDDDDEAVWAKSCS